MGVHPIFDNVLRGFCPPSAKAPLELARKRFIHQEHPLKTYQPPRCPIGQMEYIHKFGPLQIVCHLEYEIPEKGINGSPDLAAETRLISAYINSAEVSECLDKDLVKLIEIAAASQLED